MDKFIDVTVNGEIRELKMTYGLVNELARVIGDIDAIPMIGIEADLRDEVMKVLLAKRDSRGNVKETPDLFNLDIEIDQVQELLSWVGEHVLDFFLISLERGKELGKKNEDRLKALTST